MDLDAHWLGPVEYQAAWDLQRRLVEERGAGRIPDQLLLLEHPHTFTIGRSGTRDHLLVSPERLDALGATVLDVDRGGDITYHGPGQLVGYPIFDLTARGRDVHAYVRGLEEALIRLLTRFNIAASRSPGLTGVWVGDEKIAAIGVRITRWITLHGFALNVNPDLTYFEAIVPCGIRDRGVTSMARSLGSAPAPSEIAALAAECLAEVFGAVLSPGLSRPSLRETTRSSSGG